MDKRFTIAEAFETPIRGNSAYTRAFIKAHPGPYPVYSGATTGPIGNIDTYDIEGDHLSWSTDGYAGRLLVVRGKFSGTSHRAFLKPRIQGLNLEYCRLVLASTFRDAARGRLQDGKVRNEYTALPAPAVADLEFDVPLDADGNLDEAAQSKFVARWQETSEFQRAAEVLIQELAGAMTLPNLNSAAHVRKVSLTDPDAFTFLKSETGWGKKDWIGLSEEEGAFPVYSAAKAPVAFVNVRTPKLINASSERPVISFAVDGDGSAGTNFVVHDIPFYISTNRTAFIPTQATINIWYIYFALQTMKSEHGFGYTYKAYSSRLADVLVAIPALENGDFDPQAQIDEVRRLRKLYRLRDEVIDVLQVIQQGSVTVR